MAKARSRSAHVPRQRSDFESDSRSGTPSEIGSPLRRDVMSAAQRSALMSRIRGRNTGPEKRMRDILQALKVNFVEHDRSLPGRPDFVLTDQRIVVLVDGDFWHGWRFDEWKRKLSPGWRSKIASNIKRDLRNRKALRQAGWTVVRVWEHQLERSAILVRRRLKANLRRTAALRDLAQSDGSAKRRNCYTGRMNPRVLDMFCGAGGSSAGARMAGAGVVGGIDAWDVATETYADNFAGAKVQLRRMGPYSKPGKAFAEGEIDLRRRGDRRVGCRDRNLRGQLRRREGPAQANGTVQQARQGVCRGRDRSPTRIARMYEPQPRQGRGGTVRDQQRHVTLHPAVRRQTEAQVCGAGERRTAP